MSERDTKLFEVLIGQIAKDGSVDVTLGKALRVLRINRAFRASRRSAARRKAQATELTVFRTRISQQTGGVNSRSGHCPLSAAPLSEATSTLTPKRPAGRPRRAKKGPTQHNLWERKAVEARRRSS